MKADFSKCALLSREEIAAEEMAVLLKLSLHVRRGALLSPLVTEKYRALVLDITRSNL